MHKAGGPIWNPVDKNWADAYNTAWDTTRRSTRATKAGTDKKEATIAIENRALEGQYIYKYHSIKRLSARTRALSTVALRIARVASGSSQVS